MFLRSFIKSNGSNFSLFNLMSAVIARAIDADLKKPEIYQKLRALLREITFDVTGGLKMQASDRHVGYVDNRSYRKALKKLGDATGWQMVAAGLRRNFLS